MARKKLFKKTKKKTAPKKKTTKKKARATVEAPPADDEAPPPPVEQEEEEDDAEEQEEDEDIDDEGEEEVAPPVVANPFDLGGDPTRGRKRIYDLGAEMGRVWGTHTAMPMHMAPIVHIQRMPVGILEFDYMTGGGLVIGRNNRIKGPKDSLKTTMCLRALAAAQRTCRHCRWRLVPDPDTGRVNCRCPEHRFWISSAEDYIWLPPEAAISLHGGRLPVGAEMTTLKGQGRVMALKCAPPPHLKGTKGFTKPRPIPFVEEFRCEPMRCGYIDTEFTSDIKWAIANRVDPELLLFSTAPWAEMGFEQAERYALTGDIDFLVVDSTSMMETEEMLTRRKAGDRGTPGGKQRIVGDFIKRVVSASMREGVASRYPMTLLTTSHLTTKGIGGGKGTRPYLGATDGRTADHGYAMDIKIQPERFVLNAEKKQSIYGVFNFTIDKNHCGGVGSTKTKGSISYWLIETDKHSVGDANDMTTVMDAARKYGQPFISEPGKSAVKLVLHSPMISSGRRPFKSVKAAKEFLESHEGIYMDLRARLLEHMIEERHSLVVGSSGTADADAETASVSAGAQ